jgi:hypothetical protein
MLLLVSITIIVLNFTGSSSHNYIYVKSALVSSTVFRTTIIDRNVVLFKSSSIEKPQILASIPKGCDMQRLQIIKIPKTVNVNQLQSLIPHMINLLIIVDSCRFSNNHTVISGLELQV